MKYIRTKDGRIFDVSGICIPYQIVDGWIDFNSQGRFEIVKEADTIEELCDDAVVFHSYFRSTQGFWDYDPFKAAKRYAISHKEELYGAIWTDKGLIYVAKMNDKGELELL